MTITIEDLNITSNTHQLYKVTIHHHQITTLLTDTPSMVDSWVSETLRITNNNESSSERIIGLDIEWRPSFNPRVEYPVATLQLCVGSRCLIFQLIISPSIPQSLKDFLKNPEFTFVGVGIDEDVEKLLMDYDMGVAKTADVRSLAVDKYGRKELKNAGLKDLSREVLGLEIEKPKKVTMSRWDMEWLTYDQIQYATADAFLSFEIGKNLMVDVPK